MLAERIAEARARQRPVRITGAGSWLDAGRPVRASSTLSVAEHRGIVEYVPGDLTLTARAGTPISELYAATRAENQWLPLDPWGGDAGTIGATISTATAGPHAFAMGLPRDVVLGLEFINGAGETIRAGGRVVKNVAGFDLTRLLIGSWGTLGVITEVTVRLRSRPQLARTIALEVDDSTSALTQLAINLRALPFTPLAAELLNAAFAGHMGLGARTTLLLRVAGNTASVSGQLQLLRPFGAFSDAPADIWRRLRSWEPRELSTWRWSQLPSVFGQTWSAARDATRDLENAFIHGTPARGVVRVCTSDTAAAVAGAATAFDGTVAIERLPVERWITVAPRTGTSLSRAIRAKFDPNGVLNPGIMDAEP